MIGLKKRGNSGILKKLLEEFKREDEQCVMKAIKENKLYNGQNTMSKM